MRIGGKGSSCRHLRRRNFFAYHAIVNADEFCSTPNGLSPDIVIPIFAYRDDRSNRSAVATMDRAEPPLFIDRESVINTDPKSTSMVFEQRCYSLPWQAISHLN